ncbi:MAG TPA: HlyD family efflux transporter periplasmic adaptor subunit [Thermoanaerobaculia bacterium]|nr:HlyD family efflux transporter periplasmic adaptor subunit [Thermoanaerobaculia bacterium]
MDREIAPEIRRRRVMRKAGVAAVAVAAAGFSLAGVVEWLRPSIRLRDVQFARVERGDVDSTVQASGIVVPEVEQVVSSPVEARVMRVGRRPGDHVRAGDELLTLDTSGSRLEAERLGEQLAQKESEAAQLRLRIEETTATLRAQLEQGKLDADILRLQADRSRTLQGEGLLSEQQALSDAAAAKKSDITIRHIEENIVRAARTGEAQLAAAALDISMLRKERDQARRQLELAMMRASRHGVITSIVQEEGATIRRGDVLARIADLRTFRVTATVSDLYVPRIAPGMPVRVRVDDSTSVAGVLASIDPRIENGVARLNVALDASAHARLRNNLRVDVFVINGRRGGVLRVKRGANAQAQREEPFVRRDGRLVRVPVRYGLIGEEMAEVVGGLREGDEVVISNMTDYDGVKEMRLK